MVELLTVKELCQKLKVGKTLVYDLVSKRQIPHKRIGDRVLFDQEKINQWLDKKEVRVKQIA